MPNNNRIILGLLAFAIVFGNAVPGHAQEAKAQTQQQTKSNAPIVIEANELSFNDDTGDITAKGNVVIIQDGQRVEGEQINGNSKLSEIWAKDKIHFTQEGAALDGTNTLYNYKLKTGSMEQVKGKIGHKFVSGKDISLFPDEMIINEGTTTNCPAKVPDYHVSADKIEIWPGDKLIAYNAKFWIKNTVIFSLPKYRTSLQKGAQSDFPRIGYDNDDGFFIKQYLDYPFNEKLSAYVNLDYYTKAKFKPNYGLIQRESNYSIGVAQGNFRDDDGYWIKKEPEFKFSYNPHRLGNLPVSYTFTAVYGKWTDSAKSSWHQDYTLYFNRDTVKLNSTMNLNLGTGIQQVRESYNDSVHNSFKFDATVDKRWSDRVSSWAGYHYTQNNNSLFDYDKTDVSRELASGVTYRIDRMNTVGVSQSYDLSNDRLADLDYTWYRNLHCWQATITYRAKRDEIKFDLSITRW
ncbi:LPS-assembly protein LptD [Sporomusa carbonis]|uniref:LPS-assembly protein LptD n=1 Tax=Sporomusa carbonis TaxID=3076075 RepID=UPI003A76548C